MALDDERLDRLRQAMPNASFDDRFELVGEAGRGGMGIVYRAIERGTDRVLAVKVLGDEVRDHARFFLEVSLLERLSHPAIVQYLHHGATSEGRAYLAMQWLDGDNIATRLRTGPLPIADAVAIGARIATALAHAHTHDILHRDLKPSNVILVDGDATRATLIDFGVAKDMQATTLTKTGQLVGTPAYMAPEQATGRVLDARADLFSLGCLLYECVTGKPPFEGTELLDVLAQVLMRSPTPVHATRPDVPSRLEVVIAALLEKRPEDRIGDAQVVADELAAIATALATNDTKALATSSAAFRRYATTVRIRSPRRKRLVIAAIAGAALVAIATILALPYFVRDTPPDNLPKHAGDYTWLYPGQVLLRGQAMRSQDNATALVHQTDGNIVVTHDGHLLWSSNTAGRDTSMLAMQFDGNLVLYSATHAAVWDSETAGRPITGLAIQNDCNVVMYQSKRAVWDTHTYGCAPHN